MINALINFLAYIFNPLPGSLFNYYTAVLLLAVLGLILSGVLKWYIKKHKEEKLFKKLFKKFPGELFTLSLFILIYLFCRWQNIYLFSMRFLLYSLVILTILKLIKLGRLYWITYPEMMQFQKKQTQSNKYLKRK